MRNRICISLLILLVSAWAAAQVPDEKKHLFDYDTAGKTDIQEVSSYERDGATIHDITFASPKEGRVPAYLVTPAGKGPFAGIVFGHWGNGNRTEFLPEALAYAHAGAVSILIAYPWTRPEPWYRSAFNLTEPQKDIDVYVQTVVDLRRATDVLLARADVDPKRVAYVGHSYGAQWGAILSAVDRRFKTLVLMGGVATQVDLFQSDDPGIKEFLKTVPKEKVDEYLNKLAVLDAIQYIPSAAPAPVLFQFATFEQYFSKDSMQRYLKAASDPKSVLWYDTGHDLNDPRALTDRAAWLQKYIAIAAVKP